MHKRRSGAGYRNIHKCIKIEREHKTEVGDKKA